MNGYTNDFLMKLKRKNYLTPTHYLDYINSYLYLINEKSNITKQQVIKKLSVSYYKLLVGIESVTFVLSVNDFWLV